MKHYTTLDFWESYNKLPISVQKLADKNYELLKQNPKHPSLHFKKIGELWSVRVGLNYRALGVEQYRLRYLVLDRVTF
jgi:hypothetical protein